MAPRTADYYMAKLATLERKVDLVGVNLGGAGEIPGYANVNNRIDQRNADAIPNLVDDSAENIGLRFAPGSVDHVAANNIVAGTMNWTVVARGVYQILRRGGLVSLAEFAGGYDKGASMKAALEAAGFQEVLILHGVLVVAEK